MQLKRIITSALSVSLLLSTFKIGFAAEQNEVTDPLPNKGQSSITLEIKDSSGGGGTDPDNPDIPPVDPTDIIIATVPVELPIIMDLEGNITVPTDAKIINHVEDKGIKVTKINTILENDWTAANYTDNFTAKEDNTKELGLSFRNDKMDTAGEFTLTEDNWNIAANGSLLLNMQAKLPKQTVQGKGKIATVSFTIDWSGRTDGSDNVTPDNPDAETHTVTFTTDGNGILEGKTTVTVKNGEPAPFPTAKPASIRYELSDWVEVSSNSRIEPTTPIVSDVTIKAVFDTRAESPKNWFTTDGANTITGLSAEYLNMIDAPTDLVIPKTIGGSTIKSIGAGAFKNKDLVTSIVIPDTITSIEADAFSGCTSITELNLDFAYKNSISNSPFGLTTEDKIIWAPTESWDTNPMNLTQITNMGMIFNASTGAIQINTKYKDNLKGDIKLPTSVDRVKVTSIPNNGFNACLNLRGVEIPDTITSIGEAAFEQSGVQNVIIPNTITTIKPKTFSRSSLVSIDIPESVLEIGESAFYECSRLKTVNIPESVKSIGYGAFYNCISSTEITLHDNIAYIGGNAFYNCPGVKSISIPNGVENISSGAFRGCKNLTTVVLPNNLMSIGSNAFYDCIELSFIDIPDSVTNIGSGAFTNTSLTSISIPNTITSIEAGTFSGCTKLENFIINSNIQNIGNNAFKGCTGLKSINIPEGITTISPGVFMSCSGLTTIVIPDSVKTIGYDAFNGCTGIDNLDIPNSVTAIDIRAFKDIKHITYNGTATIGAPWGALSIN